MQAPAGDFLVRLVPLSGDEHYIFFLCRQNDAFDGARAVGLHIVGGRDALADFLDDRKRVFAARVVRGDEHAVGEA